jgi:hypothetical protein
MQSYPDERQLAMTALLALTMALAACSSSPPTSELRGARDAIARAEYDGARQLAPQPLQMAHDKMARAQSQVANSNMDQAKDLAEEAQADADYADAVAVVQKSTQTVQQLQGAQRQMRPRAPAPGAPAN